MKKIILGFFLILSLTVTYSIFAEEYERFAVKQGMHEKVANEKYGQPLLTEKLKSGFLPIPKKKALYEIDESTYMILKFFSGRVSEITILEDITSDEAKSMFKSQ